MMANNGLALDLEPLIDFFDYHIYVSSSLESDDYRDACTLVQKLKKEKYKLCVKYDLKNPDLSSNAIVSSGIDKSCLCILYYTPKYEEDAFFNIETSKFSRKIEHFSEKSVLIIIKKFTNTQENEVHSELKKFQSVYISSEDDFYDKILPRVKDALNETGKNLKTIYWNDETYAPGMASGYYFGYLRLVLPDMKKNFFENTLSNHEDEIESSVSKLLIIIPEDCYAPACLADGENILKTGLFVNCFYNRAGVLMRDYKSSVYKIKDNLDTDGNKEYYFIGEFATPLLTMYETQVSNRTNMTLEHLYRERDIFVHNLKSLLSHPMNLTTRNKARIVVWRNIGGGINKPETLHSVLLKVIKEELLEIRNSVQSETGVESQSFESGDELKTSEKLPTPLGATPRALYDKHECYDLTQSPKGKCLAFIYNKCFNEKDRKGYKQEIDNIKTLFGKMKFEVDIQIDLTSKELEKKCLEYQKMDHSKYGAFVCCIASHGKNGFISTKDSEYEIIKIIEFFYKDVCPTLKNKIKLFFINCCMIKSFEPNICKHKSCPNIFYSSSDAKNLIDLNSNEGGRDMSIHRASLLNEDNQNLSYGCTTNQQPTKANVVSHLSYPPDHAEVKGKRDFNLTPSSPDVFVSYSCLPSQESFRNFKQGSLYFHYLKEAFNQVDEIQEVMNTLDECINSFLRDEKNRKLELIVNQLNVLPKSLFGEDKIGTIEKILQRLELMQKNENRIIINDESDESFDSSSNEKRQIFSLKDKKQLLSEINSLFEKLNEGCISNEIFKKINKNWKALMESDDKFPIQDTFHVSSAKKPIYLNGKTD